MIGAAVLSTSRRTALRPYDGYVFVVAEYNHSITAALKNALDQAYVEWVRKPFSALGYGSAGGARAVEHLVVVLLYICWAFFGTNVAPNAWNHLHEFFHDGRHFLGIPCH